jgi:hypothetical protein
VFGTLIGLFITSTAIVIGADRAISLDNGAFEEAEKTCRTGFGSVATIQGRYAFPLKTSDKTLYFLGIFEHRCAMMNISGKQIPLKEQADIFIEELRSHLQANMSKVPPEHLVKLFRNDHHVNFVSVSGYADGVPRVFVRELRLDRTVDGQWKPTTRDTHKFSPDPCGARFHGDDRIAVKLMQGFAPHIIPQAEFLRQEVIAGLVANRTRDCSSFTQAQAWELFKTAVRLTVQYGAIEGIPDRHVGGKLTCWSITPAGGATPCKGER